MLIIRKPKQQNDERERGRAGGERLGGSTHDLQTSMSKPGQNSHPCCSHKIIHKQIAFQRRGFSVPVVVHYLPYSSQTADDSFVGV